MRAGKSEFKKGEIQKGAKVAIVVSRFNSEVTEGLLEGALRTLSSAGLTADATPVFYVPGSIEIPLIAKKLAKTKKYNGIIALGVVIKGDTDHYYYVADAVTQGVMHAMLETEVPIAFGVLTCDNMKQAKERSGTTGNKGSEAAEALLSMISLLSSF